jgi:hypothetical protein
MPRGVKMFSGMLVFGTVTAADVATSKAKPQMDPGIAHFEALLAAGAARLNLANCVKMRAFNAQAHHLLFGLSLAHFFNGWQRVMPARMAHCAG